MSDPRAVSTDTAEARHRDEGGSTLILALVLIIIISIAGAAVLKAAGSAGNVQRAYGSARDFQLALDGKVDAITQSMRGTLAPGTSSFVNAGATVCSDWSSTLGSSDGTWTY